MKPALILLTLFTVLYQKNDSDKNKRAFIDGQYYYEISVINKAPRKKFKQDVKYYWYRYNKIYSSYYDIGGKLLDGEYQKTKIIDNVLEEKGNFKNGKKVGVWKSWFKNGSLKSIITWSNGKKSGDFYRYNIVGKVIEKGKFLNGKKNGKWINYLRNDTLVYNNGNIKVRKDKKDKLLYKIFHKKDSLTKDSIRLSRKTKRKIRKEKRKAFFKKIFKSKT